MSNFKYIDCHTHAHFAAYKNDSEEVIKRALDAGVALISVGTQRDTSRAAVDLARKHDNVWACIGLHPIHTEKSFHDEQELGLPARTNADLTQTDAEKNSGGFTLQNFLEKNLGGFTSRGENFDFEYYKKLALDPKVVAIGECGLDYYRVTSDTGHETRERQQEAFLAQIELAKEVGKPLMIHCREAFDDLIDTFRPHVKDLKPSITHFFTGTKDHAQELLDMGFYFTFGGVVTFTRDYDEIIKMIPLDRILSETDAPYVTPEPFRGKRNEPAYVVYVVKKLAEIKEVSEEEMAGQIWENARVAFSL